MMMPANPRKLDDHYSKDDSEIRDGSHFSTKRDEFEEPAILRTLRQAESTYVEKGIDEI